MQAETMELYGKHGVSPLGGCLPMLVQLPMFIAFYGMLRGAFELRHAPYLWIADLTQPDELINFGGWAIPLVGWGALNLLPVLYAAMFLLGQRLQPVPEDPQAQQQQKMMKYMVVFLFFIFYSMPAALVLYFVFSQAISLLEQWYIRKYVTDLQAAPATAGAGGGVSAVPVKTSWDKQAEKDARTAEKRRQKKKDRENRPGAPR